MSKRPGLGQSYVSTHTKYHVEAMRPFTKVNGITQRLPRYYKLKMFNETQRKELANQALATVDETYSKELRRLARFHLDPAAYYDERRAYAHEKIKSKALENNKL